MTIKKRKQRELRMVPSPPITPRMGAGPNEGRREVGSRISINALTTSRATDNATTDTTSSSAPSDIESPTCPTPSSSSPDSFSRASSIMKTAARPYRSHKFPACSRCHKRRSRCTIERPGEACLLCRMSGVPCSSASSKKDAPTPRVGFARRSLISENSYSTMDDLSHIVGPIIARDTDVLERYLPQDENREETRYLNAASSPGDGHRPIYHAPIPPRRTSPAECYCTRNFPVEFLDKIDPFLDKMVTLYFEHLHPCFPIVEEACIVSRIADRSLLPVLFLVNFHAYTLFYSDLSPALAPYTRTDQDFAWSTALAAGNVDIHKSDLSMIIGLSLNIAGRPSTCVVNNTVNVARIVALSHSIGLNHDCGKWKISGEEKRVRHKTWWTVLVHDRFYNFANGTPPLINKSHYDAPMPTIEIIADGRMTSIKHVRAAECYIALCHLTEILGDILPLVYSIRSGHESGASEQTSRSEVDINRWVETLPRWLQLHEFDARPSIPGLANLQLSYLSVRMLLRRIGWHEICQREADPHSSWLLGCQAAADEIVRFVTTLHPQDFRGFWLPYNAAHFTSATTLLLRCALQTSLTEVRQSCMTSARSLVDFLRKYRDGWDLAEASLTQSEPVLKRVEDAICNNKGVPPLPRARPPQSIIQNGYQQNGPSDETGVSLNYLEDSTLKDPTMSWSMPIEEIFPELFNEFTGAALYQELE